MPHHIKTGHLRYYFKGLLSEKWKDYFFILFDDSMLQWYEKQSDAKAHGSIRIRDVAQNLRVGSYTRDLPDRPQLPRPTDEPNLIALSRSSSEPHNQEIIWILCNDATHLNEWMQAIVSTLPQQPVAPPYQQQGATFRPSAPPQPYSASHSYPQPQQQQQQQLSYPHLHGNQQPPYQHTTAVVQPSPTYGNVGGEGHGGHNQGFGKSSLATAGLGFAGGTLAGGTVDGHSGRGHRMDHGGYGEECGDHDTTVINNYSDNDTMNNEHSNHDDVNNYHDNNNPNYNDTSNSTDNQQQDNSQYDTHTDPETENIDNGEEPYDYGNGGGGYGHGRNNYDKSGDDYGAGSDAYGNSGGDDNYDDGSYDCGGSRGDFGGGDFGGGDW